MMVALLSDIHSNYYAFKACYEDAIKCGAEMFIFLGDYVSDLSEPQRTMDLVYEIQSKYPTICLRGNREGYMLDCESGRSSFIRGSKSGSLLFTYAIKPCIFRIILRSGVRTVNNDSANGFYSSPSPCIRDLEGNLIIDTPLNSVQLLIMRIIPSENDGFVLVTLDFARCN